MGNHNSPADSHCSFVSIFVGKGKDFQLCVHIARWRIPRSTNSCPVVRHAEETNSSESIDESFNQPHRQWEGKNEGGYFRIQITRNREFRLIKSEDARSLRTHAKISKAPMSKANSKLCQP